MGPGQNFLTRVRLGRVSHLWFGFENFPLKMSNFQFFSLRIKKSLRVGLKSTWYKGGSDSYLVWVKSKLGLGQGPSLQWIELGLCQKFFDPAGHVIFWVLEGTNAFVLDLPTLAKGAWHGAVREKSRKILKNSKLSQQWIKKSENWYEYYSIYFLIITLIHFTLK